MKLISARYAKDGLFVNGKKVPDGFTPVELLAAALAYGVGAKQSDLGVESYEIECVVEGGEIRCRGKCTGVEERCLVFRTLRRALAFECT
ncbi:MAG: hypothetical protein ABWJ97_04535 [Thermoproteus sp.]